MLINKDCGIILVISAIAASDCEGEPRAATTDCPPEIAAGAVGGRMGTGDLPLLMEVCMCSRWSNDLWRRESGSTGVLVSPATAPAFLSVKKRETVVVNEVVGKVVDIGIE